MKKNRFLLLTITTLLISGACKLQRAEEYDGFINASGGFPFLQINLADLLTDSSLYYALTTGTGFLLFCAGILFFALHHRDKSYLYLSLSALAGSLLYSQPFWDSYVNLPAEFWSTQMVRSIFMILYYQLFREWCRKAFYHRTKVWSYILTSALLSVSLISTVLSGHFPGITKVLWPVPLLATVLFLDSLINSILSFQRKSDRSGVAGIMALLPLAGIVLWTWLGRGYTDLFPFLNRVYFALPAFMIPWQLVLTIGLVQRRYKKEEKRNAILTQMIEDEEKQKDKLDELIATLEERNDENIRIPDYSLECARRLIGHRDELPLSLPDSWSGVQRLVAESPDWPTLGVWSRNNALLFSENYGKDSLTPLLYLQDAFQNLKMEKPALMLKALNDRMTSPAQNIERGLSGTYLYFLDSEILCGTAGSVRIYLQKKDGKIIPVQAADKPVTYKEGLGIRAQTREDGKPFRIPIASGDRIILVSCSLTDRELETSGELYGQKSLYRVLNSHSGADPEQTVAAILKDFDDFDLGNTLDRQIYAGVFQKN